MNRLIDWWARNSVAANLLMVGIFFGVRWLLRQEGPKREYHRILLRVPIVAKLTRGINTAQ